MKQVAKAEHGQLSSNSGSEGNEHDRRATDIRKGHAKACDFTDMSLIFPNPARNARPSFAMNPLRQIAFGLALFEAEQLR
jgi:hypothetical protein